MSEDLSEKITNLTITIEKYISKNEEVVQKHSDLLRQHSVELWGKDGSPGIKTHVDRLMTIGSAFKWLAGSIVAIIGERIWSIFKH